MTVSQLYLQCRKKLTHDTADFDLSQLFYAQFGAQAQHTRPNDEIAADDALIFSQKVKRLVDGYPLQYLLGEWEFYSMPLKVGEGVLIPRPDTETLVDAALGFLSQEPLAKVADFCAGSGAISLAVAQNLPQCEVYALELSKEALRYLRENTKDCPRISVMEADVLGDLAPLGLPKLDMIISNPPYLTAKELTELPQPVRYEPKMALDGGEDGLIFYRSISQSAKMLLAPNGMLLFEAGWQQAQQIADIMSGQGYHSIGFAKDLSGIDRCVYGRTPPVTDV